MNSAYDIIIVGAGLAGASAAYHLAQRGAGRILLLEREPQAGVHSSGRNAAISRQLVEDPAIAALAKESVEWMRDPPSDWQGPRELLDRSGFLLFHSSPESDSLTRIEETCSNCEIPFERLSPAEAVHRQPLLLGTPITGALFSPSDGVVDVHGLLHGFLRGAEEQGVEIQLGRDCIGLAYGAGGIEGAITDRGIVPAKAVVLAGGAWANNLGRQIGATPLPLRVTSRHLFLSGPFPVEDGPIVWRLDDEIYFRRESSGVLLSPCDLTDHPATMPGTQLEARELLLRKLTAGFPSLKDLEIRRSWAGLRILTPDGRHVLGEDPRRKQLYWAVGLGGHGVTTAWGTGRVVAEAILDGKENAPFSPARFA